jgi:fibrillarin-like rRNA methylase
MVGYLKIERGQRGGRKKLGLSNEKRVTYIGPSTGSTHKHHSQRIAW